MWHSSRPVCLPTIPQTSLNIQTSSWKNYFFVAGQTSPLGDFQWKQDCPPPIKLLEHFRFLCDLHIILIFGFGEGGVGVLLLIVHSSAQPYSNPYSYRSSGCYYPTQLNPKLQKKRMANSEMWTMARNAFGCVRSTGPANKKW